MKLGIRCFVIMAGLLAAGVCQAQLGVPWRHVPKVVVIGAEGDSRRPLVDEAILFWNKTLEEIGSGFRLPPATHTVQAVPEQALQSLSRSIEEGPRGPVSIPDELRSLPGELTIVLGESGFASFVGPLFAGGWRRIVGIRAANLPPMSFPNVARNVIVHELGHAIGLGHNGDPTALMCGRPAPCRPDLFHSDKPRVFPLTDDEKRQLLAMFPAGWKPLTVGAKPPTGTYRIGVLWLGSKPEPYFENFHRSLRALGYAEGQNLAFEHRYGQGSSKRYRDQAAELARLKVDVVLAMATPLAMEARRVTTTIPIVFWILVDPVEHGLVASLARPGGNLTGLTNMLAPEQSGKRLALLKEAVPGVSRVAVLWHPASGSASLEFGVVQAAAGHLGVQLQSLEVQTPDEFERAFEAARQGGAGALSILATPFILLNLERVAELALKYRLPAIFWGSRFARAGGLMSCGPSLQGAAQSVAAIIDKILKGAKPADLPVEQPTHFELVINLKTAKALGVEIPKSLLVQANEVIQ